MHQRDEDTVVERDVLAESASAFRQIGRTIGFAAHRHLITHRFHCIAMTVAAYGIEGVPYGERSVAPVGKIDVDFIDTTCRDLLARAVALDGDGVKLRIGAVGEGHPIDRVEPVEVGNAIIGRHAAVLNQQAESVGVYHSFLHIFHRLFARNIDSSLSFRHIARQNSCSQESQSNETLDVSFHNTK